MSEDYKVSTKEQIPKIDINLAMSQIAIAIYLEIFSETSVAIANTETFEGLGRDENILCIGFTEDGFPITTMDEYDKIKYFVKGSKMSQALITPNFIRGRRYTDANRKTTILKGWDAIASYCGCSPETCEKELQKLCDSGIQKKVYVRHVHNLVGLDSDYGLFKNPVIFSGQDWIRHNIDYNAVWNKILLPKIKSKWRILTPEIRGSLEAKKNKKLSEEYGKEVY